jgi:hypothetical protein
MLESEDGNENENRGYVRDRHVGWIGMDGSRSR